MIKLSFVSLLSTLFNCVGHSVVKSNMSYQIKFDFRLIYTVDYNDFIRPKTKKNRKSACDFSEALFFITTG